MNTNKIKPPAFLIQGKWIIHTEYPFILFLTLDNQLQVYAVKDSAEDFLIEGTLQKAQAWYNKNYLKINYRL